MEALDHVDTGLSVSATSYRQLSVGDISFRSLDNTVVQSVLSSDIEEDDVFVCVEEVVASFTAVSSLSNPIPAEAIIAAAEGCSVSILHRTFVPVESIAGWFLLHCREIAINTNDRHLIKRFSLDLMLKNWISSEVEEKIIQTSTGADPDTIEALSMSAAAALIAAKLPVQPMKAESHSTKATREVEGKGVKYAAALR
jgi:hypothetical protein